MTSKRNPAPQQRPSGPAGTPLDTEDELTCWGNYVKERMVRGPGEGVKALAEATGLPASSLAASLRGVRPPPVDKFSQIENALGIDEPEERIRHRAAALTDIWLKAARKRGWRFTKDEAEALGVAAKVIAGAVYTRTGKLTSVLWLPFLLQQLEPAQFSLGRLVLPDDHLIRAKVPPNPVEATGTHAVYDVIRSSRGVILKASAVDLEEARATLSLGEDDSDQLTIEDGSLLLRRTTADPRLIYRCSEGEPVRVACDGLVVDVETVAQTPHDAAPLRFGESITLNLENGYALQYHSLSRLFASVGQRVRAGQTIGLTGRTGREIHVLGTLPGESVPPHLVQDFEGVVVGCFLSQDGYSERNPFPLNIDPGVITPSPGQVIVVPGARLEIAHMLAEWREQQLRPFDLREALADVGEVGALSSWARFIDAPYVILPPSKVSSALILTLLLVATSLIALRRLFRGRGRPNRSDT